tara:strand:+ start:33321 stop:33977 length:657 start_codon:yes stop_codon:yes gene_type:complete
MEIIGIIDYGSGNLHSVSKSFERISKEQKRNIKVTIINEAKELNLCDRIVLPGVGTFPDCKRGIDRIQGLEEELQIQILKKSKPFLGICVGMQLLANKGFELGETDGFGWIPGNVKKIPKSSSIKIPHMGWNIIHFNKKHKILENLEIINVDEQPHAYFVHSYYFELEDEENLIGYSKYGINIAALIAKDNIIGSQFHPEKSQKFGLSFINNFINWVP